MAKNKKEMTPEERLAAALVPEEEQPYALPEGWKWVYGKGFFLPMETEYPTGDSFRYIDIESIDNSVQRVRCPKNLPVKKAPSRASRKLHIGDTLFSMVRPYLKNIAYIDEEYSDCIGSTGFYVCTPTPLVDRRYLYWLMVSPFVVNGLNHFMKGDNSPSIRKGDIEKFVYPIPLLSEQQRLVARIESLFAKLDAAKEQAQSVLDAHETRKAALLHAAFAGKLTTKWREEHKFSYNEWHLVCIKDICHSLKYGTAKKSEASGRYVVIRMGNLFDGEILWDNLAYSNDNEDIEKYQLTPGDVLFNRTNSAALVGKTSIYRGDYPAIYAGYIIKLDYDRKTIDGEFLNYIMNSPCAKTYCNKVKTDGVNQSNINAKKIGAFQFKLPSLPEQQEIVRILDRLLAREQRARQAAEETLAAIDRMKQSILARAFRGELGA